MLGQQYDSMDCKPYSTAKYYKAYRPVIPLLVSVCLRAEPCIDEIEDLRLADERQTCLKI